MRFFRSAIAKRPSSYAWTRADLSPPEAYSNNWKAYCASNAPRTVVSGRVAIFINVCPLTSQLRRARRQFGPTNLRGFGLWPRDVLLSAPLKRYRLEICNNQDLPPPSSTGLEPALLSSPNGLQL